MPPHPNERMFGIKIILPAHLGHRFFTHDFNGPSGRKTLMNFPDDDRGLATAGNIPVGHRSLVYCTQPVGGFLWAIEYTGTLKDGRAAGIAHSLTGVEYGRWNQMRPIRIIARIHDDLRAAKPADIFVRTGGEGAGIQFVPNSFTHKYISRQEYQRMFDVIEWDWVEGRD